MEPAVGDGLVRNLQTRRRLAFKGSHCWCWESILSSLSICRTDRGSMDADKNAADDGTPSRRITNTSISTALGKIALGSGAYLTAHTVLTHLPQKIQRSLPMPEKSLFLLNSVVSGAAGARVLLSDDFSSDLLRTYPSWLDNVFAAFGGYMVYDTILGSALSDRSLLMHHTAGLLGTLGTMSIKVGSFFPAFTLFTEASLPSVYLLQSLKRQGYDGSSRAFRSAVVLRVIFLLTTRTFTAPLAVYRAYHGIKRDIAKMHNMTAESVSAARVWAHLWNILPAWVTVATALNLSFFTALNFLWTWQICNKSYKLLNPREPIAASF